MGLPANSSDRSGNPLAGCENVRSMAEDSVEHALSVCVSAPAAEGAPGVEGGEVGGGGAGEEVEAGGAEGGEGGGANANARSSTCCVNSCGARASVSRCTYVFCSSS